MEESYHTILNEYLKLEEKFLVSWPEKYLCKKGWDVYAFYAFDNKFVENCNRCPETTKILESIPGMSTSLFSFLQPKTHIRPHVGYYNYSNNVLRAHLGIVIPPGAELKVNGKEKKWKPGKVFIFDDTFRHEAYNKSNELRVVLMIDFKFKGDPNQRNPSFIHKSSEGNDLPLVSPFLIDAISSFITPKNISEQKEI